MRIAFKDVHERFVGVNDLFFFVCAVDKKTARYFIDKFLYLEGGVHVLRAERGAQLLLLFFKSFGVGGQTQQREHYAWLNAVIVHRQTP